MSVDRSREAFFRSLHEMNAGYRDIPQGEEPLQGGGGGGTFGGMEIRIARLESDMEHVKRSVDKLDRGQDVLRADVTEIKTGVAVLSERMSHLPSKGYIATVSGAALAIIAALVAFSDKIHALIG